MIKIQACELIPLTSFGYDTGKRIIPSVSFLHIESSKKMNNLKSIVLLIDTEINLSEMIIDF